ncbi:hypothetical protein DFH09DRAFT_1339972 [Mycena vulgaris]|nr:hypothetical protein DFH09DRAFT_1339972 [Mycena vulgaris]
MSKTPIPYPPDGSPAAQEPPHLQPSPGPKENRGEPPAGPRDHYCTHATFVQLTHDIDAVLEWVKARKVRLFSIRWVSSLRFGFARLTAFISLLHPAPPRRAPRAAPHARAHARDCPMHLLYLVQSHGEKALGGAWLKNQRQGQGRDVKQADASWGAPFALARVRGDVRRWFTPGSAGYFNEVCAIRQAALGHETAPAGLYDHGVGP